MSSGQCGTRLDWHWVPAWLSKRVSSKCCVQRRVLLHVDVDGLRCQPLLSTAREIAALVTVDLLVKRASDDRRIKIQLLKDFREGSQGFRGVQSTGNLFVVMKHLLLTTSNNHGWLVEAPFWFLYPFAVSVLQEYLRHGCARLASQQTSRQPSDKPRSSPSAHVPDAQHIGNVFQPHFEVGGSSRHTVLLAKKSPHRLRRARHILAHL